MATQPVPTQAGGLIEISQQIEISHHGPALVFRIDGELDDETRPAIEHALHAAITKAGSVVLDLRDLTFCDSRGIAMFIGAFERAKQAGTALVVRHLRPQIQRIFEIANVTMPPEPGIPPVE